MKRAVVLAMILFVAGCGGSSDPGPGVTSPSINLVGSYILVWYERNGVAQTIGNGDLEIGKTQIATTGAPTPAYSNGTYDYVIASSIEGDYIKATSNGVTVYSVYIVADNTTTLRTWRLMNNVLYDVFWEKVSDSTAMK